MAETMAMALAELRPIRRGRAVAAGCDLRRRSEGKRDDLARKLSVNLQLYQSGQPCRTPWTDDDPVHHPVSEQ